MAHCSACGDAGVVMPLPMIERLVETVGDEDFKEALLQSLDETMMASDCVVFLVDRGKLSSVFEVSQTNSTELSSLISRYLHHFPDRDRRLGSRRISLPTSKVTCRAITDISNVETSNFRRNFYGEGDFVDQAWSIMRHQDSFVALCAFRRRARGRFEPGQIDRFAQFAPVFMPFVSRHVVSSRPLSTPGSRLPLERAKVAIAAADASLAPKEIEVCARILRGMTSEGIALDLQTSIHTVRTHRKRAYRKMQITSMDELFSRAIDAERMASRGVLALPAS